MALFLIPFLPAATVTFDGGAGGTGTTLDTPGNWSDDALPATTSEVLFDNSLAALPAQLTTTGANLVWGDLIWSNNSSASITIDTATSTSRSITLSGGGGSAEALIHGGSTGDLILLGSNALTNTLHIGGNAGVGSGRLNLILGASGNLNVVNSGATLNITSVISGAYDLNKTGAGTLTLSGNNTFGGATSNFTLTEGTLNINAAAALGNASNTFIIDGGRFDNTSGTTITTSAYKQIWNSDFAFVGTNSLSLGAGAVTLGTAAGDSRTVTVHGSTLTLGGIVSNGATANSLIKDGAGTLSLTNANSFTGGITIKSGTVSAGANTALGTGAITLGDTGGSSDATLLANRTGTLAIANAIVVASGSSGNALTIANPSGGTTNTTFSGAVSLGHDLTITNANTSYLTFSGVITESAGPSGLIVNAGTGSVAVTANNNFSGGVTLNSGRLQFGTLNSAGTGLFTITGGSIDASSSAAVLNNSGYAWNGDFGFKGTSSVTLGTGHVTLGGDRTVTTTMINSAALIVSGGIGDGGNAYSLTKRGIGTLTLNGPNTYSGATIVQGGTLNLNGAASSLVSTSGVTVTAGTFNLGVGAGTGVANRINPASTLTLGGSGVFSIAAGATAPVNSQSFATLSVAPGSSQLSTNSVTNAGTFAFTGAGSTVYARSLGGTLRILMGTNTRFIQAPTGSSTIGSDASAILIGAVTGSTVTATAVTDFVLARAGTIAAPDYVNDMWASGINTNVTTDFTATGPTQSLRFNAAGQLIVTLTGTSTIESGGVLVTSNAVGGGIITGGTLQASSGQDLWIYTSTPSNSSQRLQIDSLIIDNGSSSLTKSGPGKLSLNNASNSYAGGTFLGQGTLTINSGGALGTGGLTFTGNSTLQISAANVSLGERSITVAAGQTATFDTNGDANTLTVGGVISGEGGLTKTGLGTLALTAANTYTGTTVVNGGTLKLDFSAVGAPVSNIISNDSLFSPGSGSNLVLTASSQTILIQGKDATANSQTFGGAYTNVLGNTETAGVYLNRGMTRFNLLAGAGGGTLAVHLGTVTRGHTTDVNNSLDISIGTGVTVTADNAAGLLGNYATVNGNTWAMVSGGHITGYSSYSTSFSTANAVLDVGSGGTLSANPNSLRFNSAGAATVNLGTGVVRAIAGGGILVTANVGANTSTIGEGALVGFASRDLVIHQNNTAGDLQINASIVDVIARTTTISKNGLGTTILTGRNTNTGATYINEGTLIVTGDASASFTKTATSTASNAVLAMTDTNGVFIGQSVTQAAALTASSVTWTVVAINPGVSVTLSSNANVAVTNGTFTFGAGGGLGANAAAGHHIAPEATLQIGTGGTSGSLVTGQSLTNNGTLKLNRSDDFTFAHLILGTGTVEKLGAGNATLVGANTFTGDTRIAGGTLTLATSTNLQGSTLDYNSYGGSLSFGALTSATLGGLKGNQPLVLSNASAAAVTLVVGANHQDTTYSGNLSGNGAVSKTGGGALTLQGDNTYTGSTSVSQGTLNLEGTFTDAGALTVSGGVLNLSGTYKRTTYVTATGGLTVSGGIFNLTGTLGTSVAVPTAQTAFIGNSVTNFSGTAFMSGSSSTFRVGDITSGTVNVTAGTLTLGTGSAGFILGRGNASASGFFNISGGSVIIPGASTVVRIGAGYANTETSGASILSMTGGSFDTGVSTSLFLLGSNLSGNTASTGTVNLDGGTLATNRAITGGAIGASIFNFNGGTLKANGTNMTLATTLTTLNVRNGGAFIDTADFNVTIARALDHSSIAGDAPIDGGLTKSGAGILTLTGASTYTGPTLISSGTLKAGIATTGSSGAFGYRSAVTLANVAGASLDISGFDTTLGSLAGGGSTGGDVILGSATLTVGANGASTTYAGLISGTAGELIKVGTGTLRLNGDSTYSGGTTVQAGALLVGNIGSFASATGSGPIAVQAGATLGGNGRIELALDHSISITGGTLSVGDHTLSTPAAGILELVASGIGTISLDSTATFALDLISRASQPGEYGDSDRAIIAGGLSIASGATLSIGNPTGITGFAGGDEWLLFDWTDLAAPADGVFTNLNLPALGPLLEWNLERLYSHGVLSIAVVPEPSRVVLLLVASATLLFRRRRA